jgi:hypothetical protein
LAGFVAVNVAIGAAIGVSYALATVDDWYALAWGVGGVMCVCGGLASPFLLVAGVWLASRSATAPTPPALGQSP